MQLDWPEMNTLPLAGERRFLRAWALALAVPVACVTQASPPDNMVSPGNSPALLGGSKLGDAASDSTLTAASITVTGLVTTPNYATDPPATATVAGAGVTVAYTLAGAAQTATTDTSGAVTITGIDVSDPVTWLTVTDTVGCSIVGNYFTTAQHQSIVLPLYSNTFASSLAYVLSGFATIPTAGTATVVLQFVNTSGQPAAGITAANFGGQPAFYDTAQDAFWTSGGTGSYGTIVFLGVNPTNSGSSVQVQLGETGSSAPTPNLQLRADCVTYLLLYVE